MLCNTISIKTNPLAEPAIINNDQLSPEDCFGT